MRKLFSILAAVLLTATMWAQNTPQKISYQAVIRDASNNLVTNHAVGMQISILKGSTSGIVVYTETQTATTNSNGLVSIEIGGGTGFDTINWAKGSYFIKTETDPTGGTNYTITGISQLLSVPYALHAKTADNGFSGNFNDLSNKPALFDGQYSSLQGTPSFATIATSGNYNDLLNLPTLFNGNFNNLTNKPTLFSGAYADLTGKPALWDSSWTNIKNKPTLFDGEYLNLTNKPTLFSGAYADLTGKPALRISNDTIYLTNGGFVKIPEQKSVPALIAQDDFSYILPLKNYWSSAITGGASIALSNSTAILSTNGAGNTAKLYSNKQKSVSEGKLIFTAVLYTYEDNNTAYGPLTRGLVNGTNRNNAIEFINISGNTIQARTVSGGTATTTNYSVGASVANYYSYTIIATTTKVEFYFDGTLIATHTTNIPTLPLNMYFDVSTSSGNVPQYVDDAKFEIIRY